jgi:hypothetical protein
VLEDAFRDVVVVRLGVAVHVHSNDADAVLADTIAFGNKVLDLCVLLCSPGLSLLVRA